MELIDFLKSLWGVSGAVIGFTLLGLLFGAYLSYKDGKTSDRIDSGVGKIDTIVTNSENRLKDASESILINNALVIENLKKTIDANKQLQKTNEQLGIASGQLQQNYEQIVATLNTTIKVKDEAIKSKDEIIGQTTGGESYPSLSIKKGGFYLANRGIYSIPNLQVSIRLIPNCLNIPRNATLEYLRNEPTDPKYVIPIYYKKYPKLWAGLSIESIDIKNLNSYIPNDKGIMHAFEIYFESDYKRWMQRIRIISHNGKWEVAEVLDEIPTTQRSNVYSNEKEIFKHISENFPTFEGLGTTKVIPFFNAKFDHPTRFNFIIIDYNQENGIAERSFDDF